MEEPKKIYNLYSQQMKKVILGLHHKLMSKRYFANPEKSTELICVVDGECKITFEENKITDLKAGDLIVINKDRKYEAVFAEETEVFILKFLFSDFVDTQFKIFDKGNINKFIGFIENTADKINSIHFNAAKIQEILFLIENQFENRDLCSEYVIKAYVGLIFTLIFQYYFGVSGVIDINKTTHYKDIEKALNYIHDNLTEKISLEKLSKIAAMGKTNFSGVFKQVTGMTVWEYIQNARVELASSYLIENKNDFSITEVALKSGFNTSAHFNKTFKKLKGQTPRDFRNMPDNPCF